MQEASENCCVR